MIVTVNSQLLANELRLLAKIVPTKPAVAILSHVLLSAVDQQLNLYATDLEVAITTSCPGRVDAPGSMTLPVAKLLAMVEQFPDDDVSISLDKNQAVIVCGAFTSRLKALPVDDFPDPPVLAGPMDAFDVASLRSLIAKTRHAVSAAGTKYVLKGALLTCVGQVAAMVATEGKRLAMATMSRTGVDLNVIIPVKTLDVLAGQTDEGDLQLTVGDRHLFFAIGGRLLTSRKMEGEFPKYQRIIPGDNALVLTVDRMALAAALRRVVLAAEDNGAVYFNLLPNRLELSAASVGLGSANEAVPMTYDGTPLKTCLNGSYVLDFLDASTEPTITLALKDVKSSLLLTDGTDHVGVIGMMRT